MSKKKNRIDDFDDWGGFDDFNVDDFGFDAPPIKDDRSPVSKIAGSFLSGAKSTAYNRDFQKQMLRRALPRDYESGFERHEQFSSFFYSLNEGVKRELRPGLKQIRDASRSMFPGKIPFVPESWRDSFNEYVDGYDTKRRTQEQEDDARVGIMLGDIFTAQAEVQESRDRETQVREEIKNITDRKRFEVTHIERVRTNSLLTSMVNYQDQVTTAYRKRVLELQYKSYLTQVRLLETTKQQSEKTNVFLEAVQKNTALPDFVKLRNKEAMKEMARQRVFAGVLGKASSSVSGLTDRFLNRARENIEGMARQVSDAMDMLAGFAGMMDDGEERSIQEELLEKAKMGGDLAGGELSAWMIGKIADKTRGWFRRGRSGGVRDRVARAGKRVHYYTANMDQHLQDWGSRSDGGVLRSAAELVGLDAELFKQGADLSRMQYGIDAVSGPGGSIQTRMSLEEVIPGWLSRIWGEMRMLRTGTDSYQSETYDYKLRKFVSVSQSARGIAETMFGDRSGTARMHDIAVKQAKEFLGDQPVSKEAFDAVVKRIKMDALQGLTPSAEKYRFNIGVPVSDKAQSEIRSAIEKHHEYDWGTDSFSRSDRMIGVRQRIQGHHSTLMGSMAVARNDAIRHMEEGKLDALRSLGLVKETGDGLDFDYSRYFDLTEQGVDLNALGMPPPGQGPTSPLPRGPRRRTGGPSIGLGSRADLPSSEVRLSSDEELMTQLISMNASSAMQTEIQKEILQKLYTGVVAAATPAPSADGAPASRGPMVLDFNAMANRLTGVGKRVAGWAGKFGGSVFKFTGNRVAQIPGLVMSASNLLRKHALPAAGATLSRLAEPLKERFFKLTDVYVKGERRPRLTFTGLMNGDYIDRASGRVIKRLEDIRGAVIDATGKEVLSDIEATAGDLVTRTGKKITTFGRGIIHNTRSLIGGALNTGRDILGGFLRSDGLRDAISSAGHLGARGIDAIGNVVGRLPGFLGTAGRGAMGALRGAGNIVGNGLGLGSHRQLERIYELLDYRMPGAPGSHLQGHLDRDGDGLRDGSWQARQKERDAKKGGDGDEDEKEESKADTLEAAMTGGLMGTIMSMFGLGGGRGEAVKDGASSMFGGIGEAILGTAIGERIFGRKSKAGKAKRWLGKGKGGFLRSLGRGLMGGAAFGGAGIGGKLGGIAGKAVHGTAKWGVVKPLQLAGKASWGATKLAGRGAMWAGMKALPFLMSPVGLAVLGVGAAAYLGYKYYQHSKAFKDEYLLQLRMMHYGFSATDEDATSRILALEEMRAKDFIHPGAQIPFKELSSQEDIYKFIQIMGGNPQDEYQSAVIAEWWLRRGGPVMAKWFNVVHSITEHRDLTKINGLDPDIKLKILEAVNLPTENVESPLNFPFVPRGGNQDDAVLGKPIRNFYDKTVNQARKEVRDAEKRREKEQAARDAQIAQMYRDADAGKREAVKRNIDVHPSLGPLKAELLNEQKKDVSNLLDFNAVMMDVGAKMKSDQDDLQTADKWVWPMLTGRISSEFKDRINPVTGKMENHKGVDIAAEEGTEVFAAAAGVLTRCEYSKSYGNVIYIEHANGMTTRYAHLHGFAPGMALGVRVKAGQLIGFVGNTGESRGNHLHFEIGDGPNITSKRVDPVEYINDQRARMAKNEVAKRKEAVAQNRHEDGYTGDPGTTMEGVDTIDGTTNPDAITPLTKDMPLFMSPQHLQNQRTAAAGLPGIPGTAAPGTFGAAREDIYNSDMMDASLQQVDGINKVAGGVGNMTDLQRRTNQLLEELTARDNFAERRPMFRTQDDYNEAYARRQRQLERRARGTAEREMERDIRNQAYGRPAQPTRAEEMARQNRLNASPRSM